MPSFVVAFVVVLHKPYCRHGPAALKLASGEMPRIQHPMDHTQPSYKLLLYKRYPGSQDLTLTVYMIGLTLSRYEN